MTDPYPVNDSLVQDLPFSLFQAVERDVLHNAMDSKMLGRVILFN